MLSKMVLKIGAFLNKDIRDFIKESINSLLKLIGCNYYFALLILRISLNYDL